MSKFSVDSEGFQIIIKEPIKKGDKFDCHGVIQHNMKKWLNKNLFNKENAPYDIKLITGKGNHSRNKKSVLTPFIRRLVKENNQKYNNKIKKWKHYWYIRTDKGVMHLFRTQIRESKKKIPDKKKVTNNIIPTKWMKMQQEKHPSTLATSGGNIQTKCTIIHTKRGIRLKEELKFNCKICGKLIGNHNDTFKHEQTCKVKSNSPVRKITYKCPYCPFNGNKIALNKHLKGNHFKTKSKKLREIKKEEICEKKTKIKSKDYFKCFYCENDCGFAGSFEEVFHHEMMSCPEVRKDCSLFNKSNYMFSNSFITIEVKPEYSGILKIFPYTNEKRIYYNFKKYKFRIIKGKKVIESFEQIELIDHENPEKYCSIQGLFKNTNGLIQIFYGKISDYGIFNNFKKLIKNEKEIIDEGEIEVSINPGSETIFINPKGLFSMRYKGIIT